MSLTPDEQKLLDAMRVDLPPLLAVPLAEVFRSLAAAREELAKEREAREQTEKRTAELERQVAFWAGEGQRDRAEVVEWQTLVNKKVRSTQENDRLRAIASILMDENRSEPELRDRIAQLEAENAALREAIIEGDSERKRLTLEVARLREATKPLVWTKVPPTEPGWYFWRKFPNDESRCHCVWRGSSGTLFVNVSAVQDCDGEWAGPIPQPQEPSDG